MSFHLSPTSLGDQREVDLHNLLGNSTLPFDTKAYTSSSMGIPHNATVSQVLVINSSSDNIYRRQVDYQSAHAAITRSAVMEEKRRTYLISPPLFAGSKPSKREVYDVDSVKAAAQLEASQARPSASAPRSTTADLLVPGRKRTPRPKTAPSLPSCSTSQPRPEPWKHSSGRHRPSSGGAAIPNFDAGAVTATVPATDEDVLLAFLNTVEQDSRDRSSPIRATSSQDRPRTSRGNTASSSKSHDLTEGEESDPSTITGHGLDLRGRRGSSYARPWSAVGQPDNNNARTRASSSGGSRSRGATSDGSGSSGRPSTAVGDAVKPFGFGMLVSSPRRGSLVPSLQDRECAISDDEEGEAEAELGSVIEREYAKLVARAGASPEVPC